MQRMKNPAVLVPAAMQPIQNLMAATRTQGVPEELLDLVHLRVSQINGCGFCVDAGVKSLTKAGETGERIGVVAAWRETPYYSEPERAALALAEAVTDRPAAVPDDVWDAAAAHFSEPQLAAILLTIATTNLFNRLNAPIRQQAGSW
ncbi:alkyl hydroperoxide reductase AhpD [Actinoplanes lobatus]|uniref:AhpD family alkylhydroperoxidase n=1 Tax=Actinoplanes lobatus TaxID=113568 RepID=A0A7W7HPV1_9ACTN|nr:carboxymuconolactone decarboxylase family protein [Actinoplanes lobatus]MBB4754267.1 AhpD family alkylhydroperoxidase [Actinoplanes lobatus]GGN62205.1 alkyl hydroperoxide reductase AhpD [Actinoplanes lobatus]GIE46067.1 alkyl hydroperoxide reductase AhpD [Actinoplanes lobatus]